MGWKNRIEFEAPSTKSVLAFMLLPQFKRMLPAFAHIGPIFVRTIAIMFAQSGLLRPNHPAIMYGSSKDLPKFKFFDLIGEAWYNLRVGEGVTPYHYGLFAGVILMICLTISGAILFVVNLTLSTASAQLFGHPSGNPTGFSEVPVADEGLMFDTATGNPDLALSILDKVLRQPYMGTGGALQNGLGPLIEFYNTALLVIAAIIVFWAIISIVIDTARTGQVGGGRHSIVWLPIRFVFAMGLMIPMANGFNGGQAIVMKLAEWGSNLGSQGWSIYVQSVANEALLADYTLLSVQELAGAATRMKLCEIAYNTVIYNAMVGDSGNNTDLDALPESDRIEPHVRGPYEYKDSDYFNGWLDLAYVGDSWGNENNKMLCGGYTISNPANAWRDPSQIPARLVRVITRASPSEVEGAKFRQRMRVAHANAFLEMLGNAEEMACVYAKDHMKYESSTFFDPGISAIGQELTNHGVNAASLYNSGNAVNCSAQTSACGSEGVYGDNDVPSSTCLRSMAIQYQDTIEAAYETGGQSIRDFLIDDGEESFTNEINSRGWAAMGSFYHKVASLNSGLKAALDDLPNILESEIEEIAMASLEESSDKPKSENTYAVEVASVMLKYDAWWRGTPVEEDGFALAASARGGLLEAGGSFSSMLNSAFSYIMGGDGHLIYSLEGSDSDTYPLAQLTKVGDDIISKAMLFYGFILAVTLGKAAWVLGGVGFTISAFSNAVSGAMEGPIGGLFGTIAMAGLGAGMVLKYYVPMIPWIRVTFAVLAWIVSVVEAVIVIPLLALANLNSEGDGLLAPNAKNMYQLALNLLFRPIMVVLGFVLGMLIFNAMVLYVNDTFIAASHSLTGQSGPSVFGQIAFTIIYVFVIYSMANSTFKLVDTIPAALMKWMGGPQDDNFQDTAGEGHIIAMGGAAGGVMRPGGGGRPPNKKDKEGGGPTDSGPSTKG